ncbi:MAG: carbohydrate ABC transporter substrate-binding protein [Actinobacteria bacterium]|nr:carbohydrate ABC transporter substrate-binding protein [Actinomycetota bacterium]
MRKFRLMVLPFALILLAAACAADEGDGQQQEEESADTGSVSLFAAMEPFEAEALQAVLDDLVNSETDYTAEIEASADFEEQAQIRVEGGNPPDVIMYPQPGAVLEQAEAGNAIALEDMGFDIAELEATFGSYLLSLGEFEGKHYGIPTNINLKSTVWYAKDDFDAAGYQVPTTFDEMLTLSDQIVADGGTPWCVGFESGGATGWPATDWMEDIMLRTAGPDVYDQWVTHEIPFNDPAVAHAAELLGQVMFTEGYVLGGADQTPSIAFGDAPLPMFDDPPGCFMHRQANFIIAFFPEDAEAGVDYDSFAFPAIEQPGESALFAGELSAVFRDAPEVRDFIERFVSQPVQCAQGESQETSRISPNIEVGPECYTNPLLAQAAGVLTESLAADTARFDASDLMPSAVGAGSFWTGMVEYMQGGPDALQGVLDDIEASWPE